jgi:tetratricopeptide (TPR) repeat protein
MTNAWLRSTVRAGAVIAAVAGLRFFCFVPYQASLMIAALEERTTKAEAGDSAARAELARLNVEDLARIEAARRLDPEWYLLYAENCQLLGRQQDAAASYSRALQIDQRPEIYMYRGLLMLQLGRIDDAVSDLATAARFKPDILFDVGGDLRTRVAAAAGMH